MLNSAAKAPPVLIFQMGKVGSMSILYSLQESKAPNPVFHVHFLSQEGIRQAEEYYRTNSKARLPEHLYASRYVSDLLKRTNGTCRWKVISLVRDPIARQLSNLFQNLDTIMPEALSRPDESTAANICDYLYDGYKDFDESEDYACTWFDREMNPTFDFNIFDHPFQPEKGYETYRAHSADILVMRLEDVNRIAEQAVTRFLGLSHFSLVTRNRAADKNTRRLYQEVQSRFKLPSEVVERIYGSRFAGYFYTQKEIERLKLKWSQRRSTGVLPLRKSDESKPTAKRIMVIHPEGNLNNNPNLTGIIQILCEKEYAVDYYALKKQFSQKSPCQGANIFLKDPQGRTELDGLVNLSAADLQPSGKGAQRVGNTLPRYDLIIGIDRGIIEANLLARQLRVPYGLISYEIFFRAETGERFKNSEIQACRDVAFAVCQDRLRAQHLIQENRIPQNRLIILPMGAREAFAPQRNDYLHKKLRIPAHKKIALVIGSLSQWTMIDYILASLKAWPEDWVLVLHGRYGLASDELGIFKRFQYSRNVRFSLQPADSFSALKKIIQSADVGLAFYRPVHDSPYTGDNIRHIGMASGKIAAYLQCALPVIINEIGVMSEHVRRHGLGRVVDVSAGFSPEIAPDRLEAMRTSCNHFYNLNLDLDRTIRPLLERIESLTEIRSRVCASAATPFSLMSAAPKNSAAFPKISVVTPSMNQAKYLERCMLSVLDQNYPNLEYIVMDGGSTDGSKEIIEKHAEKLAYWQCKPDKGQYHAIEEGLDRSTGDIITWLNSDDQFAPHAFFIAATIFMQHPEIEWITGRRASTDGTGLDFYINSQLALWSRQKYLDGLYDNPFIQQEGTFWRRSLWERAGDKLDTSLALAGDLELWARFFRFAPLYSVDFALAFYRAHGDNKAIQQMEQYKLEAEQVIARERILIKKECEPFLPPAPLPITRREIAACLANNRIRPPDPAELNTIRARTAGTTPAAKPNLTCRLIEIDEFDVQQDHLQKTCDGEKPARMAVSFILPTKERPAGLCAVLDSLAEAMQDLTYEIILYTEKPGGAVTDLMRKYGIKKVFYDQDLFNERDRFSWTRLMNHAFSQASGEWTMFGSDDIVFFPSCFKRALSQAVNQSDPAVVGGIAFMHRNTVDTSDGFFKNFGYDTLNGDKAYINFGLIRTDAFKHTSGFDENLKFFWGDVDICAQLWDLGYKILPSYLSLVDHNNMLETKQKDARNTVFGVDTRYFLKKWHGSPLFGQQNPLEKVRYYLKPGDAARAIGALHGVHNHKADSDFVDPGSEKMHVVIDGVIFQFQPKCTQGISRVWRTLIALLVRQMPHARITVIQRDGFRVPVKDVDVHKMPAFILGDAATLDLDDQRLGRLCHNLKADLFISTYYTRAPGVTNMMMVHDLIPEFMGMDLSQPEWLAKQRIIDTADGYINVSRATQNDLKKYYPQTTNRPMIVAHNGLDACFKQADEKEITRVRMKFDLREPYVMLVGNRHGYKNGLAFLNAYAKMAPADRPLVLCVGGEADLSAAERRIQNDLPVRYVGSLSDCDLAALYGGADALFVPSLYEGFGLPVIEALACGCPVIAQKSPAVEEVGGDAILYADLSSTAAILKTLQQVRKAENREALKFSGMRRAARFDWVETSKSISRFIDGRAAQPSIILTAIVSTYNAARFIRGCLEDLENQTIADRMEIIVVDSASEQDESVIVRDFQKTYPNIKYIRTAFRENVYQAWNRGIKFALGKYITNANTDDRHRRDAFEQMVRVLDVDESVALVYADVIKTRTANETFDQCTPTGMFRWHDWDRRTLLTKGCFIGPQPVWRKTVHETYGYFDESYAVSSDFEFWLRISQTLDFHHISKPLGLYLERPDSVEHADAMKKSQEDKRIFSIYQQAAADNKLIGLKERDEAQAAWAGSANSPSGQSRITDPNGETAAAATGIPQGDKTMNSPEPILKAIQFLIDSSQKEAAYWVLDKLLKELPDCSDLCEKAGSLAYETGDMEAAMHHFELAVKLSPENAAYRKNLGDFFYVIEKNLPKALLHYEKALLIEPQNIEALIMAGHVSVALRRYQDAQTYYNRVLSLDPGNSEIQGLVDKINNHALNHHANEMTVDEIHASAAARASAGDRAGAIAMLEQLLGHDCDKALIHNDLGVLFYECGKMTEARKHYENAAALQPENEIYQKNLADFYWVEMKDHRKAMEIYVQVLKLDPQDIDALLNCGQICLVLGKHRDAHDFFETALEIEPWNQDARKMLDQLDENTIPATIPGNNDHTGRPISETISASPDDHAIADLKRKLAQSPQNATLHNDLGVLCYENGEKEKALASYLKAVELEPDEPNYLKNLADFYLIEQGRTEEAMKLYLQVLTQDPEDVEALNAAGMVCASLGKLGDARYFYHRVLEIQPWDENAANALNNLPEDARLEPAVNNGVYATG